MCWVVVLQVICAGIVAYACVYLYLRKDRLATIEAIDADVNATKDERMRHINGPIVEFEMAISCNQTDTGTHKPGCRCSTRLDAIDKHIKDARALLRPQFRRYMATWLLFEYVYYQRVMWYIRMLDDVNTMEKAVAQMRASGLPTK